LVKDAGQTRVYPVAKGAAVRAARPDPSLRKRRWLGMTIKLHHYLHSNDSLQNCEIGFGLGSSQIIAA